MSVNCVMSVNCIDHVSDLTISLLDFATVLTVRYFFPFSVIVIVVIYNQKLVKVQVRRVSLVEQELLTLPKNLSSTPVLVEFVLLDI
jgi:hypothetical protein